MLKKARFFFFFEIFSSSSSRLKIANSGERKVFQEFSRRALLSCSVAFSPWLLARGRKGTDKRDQAKTMEFAVKVAKTRYT